MFFMKPKSNQKKYYISNNIFNPEFDNSFNSLLNFRFLHN